jgi:GNAT superfamily N-acetyltransferase
MKTLDITFRLAAQGDLLRLAAIDHGRAPDHRSLHIEQKILEGCCWLAAVSTVPVAFGFLRFDWFGHPFIELLVVHPEHRRRGVGRALLQHLIDCAGPGRIFTSTNASNGPMKRLLESKGFRRSGEIDNLDAGDSEIVYILTDRALGG